jgi:hypothetical protein
LLNGDVKGGSSSTASNENKADCSKIVSDFIKVNKDNFNQDEGIILDLSELSESDRNCFPKEDGFIASVETSLKLAEAVGLTGTPKARVVNASVETYLKYAEAVGLNINEEPMRNKVLASVETYLKYAEAVGYTQNGSPQESEERIKIASVETYLKYAEAVNDPTPNLAIASIETYLKFWEAMGGPISDYKTRGKIETLLKLAEATDEDPYKKYLNSALFLTGYWTSYLEDKGVVVDGQNLFTSSNTFLSSFSIDKNLYYTYQMQEMTDRFLDKGIVLDGVNLKDISIISSFNKDLSYEGLDRILDRGAVFNRTIFDHLPNLNITSNQNSDRLLDKGIVLDGNFSEIKGILQILLRGEEKSYDDTDRILDKGFAATINSKLILQGFLENELFEGATYIEKADRLLDKGYHIEVRGNMIFIRSIEMYLKYKEAVGGGGSAAVPA